MKRIYKILMYLAGSILLLLLLVLIFHNAIISHTLKTVINKESEGKVELKVEDFDFNLINGSIMITDPELVMTEVYLNESENMSLDRVVFNTITIDLLDLKKLVKDRNIIARKFIINKPEIWFTEKGTDVQTSFHPDKLFEALNHNPGLFKMLQVKISDIEIHYGSINILEQTGTEIDPGVLDFTILLHDFNSALKSDSIKKRILFSEELQFKLKDLKRVLSSGYTLKMDSAVFSTKKRDLEIGGAAFIPGKENLEENAVEIFAGQLILGDIELEEVRGLEDLHLSAVHLSDGHFTTFRNGEKEAKSEPDSTRNLESLKKLFYDFFLDSITISHFDYFNVDDLTDTSLIAGDIHFLLSGIKIDSGMLDDPFRSFRYDTIKLSSGKFEMDQFIPGLKLKYRDLSYSNKDRNLRVTEIVVKNDSSERIPDKIDLKIRELDIQGFSLKRFQKKQTQRLSVEVYSPDLSLDLVSYSKRKKTIHGKRFVPEHLQFESVILKNGNLGLLMEDKLEIALKGVNGSVEEFIFPDQTHTNFRYQNLVFDYQNLIGRINDGQLSFVTGAMAFRQNELSIQNASGSYKNKKTGKLADFTFKSVDLDGFSLNHLLVNKELLIDSVKLDEPSLSGTIDIFSEKRNEEKPVPSGKYLFPFKTVVGAIDIQKGNVITTLNLESDTIDIETDFNTRISRLGVNKGDSLKMLIDQLLWELDLQNSRFVVKDHEVKIGELETNSQNADFTFKNLTVRSLLKADSLTDKFKIRNLIVPSLEIVGVDYKLFLKEDSLKLKSFTLTNARFDLFLPKSEKRNISQKNQKKFDLRKYLKVNYDTVALINVNGKMVQHGELSHQIYSVKGFSFKHVNGDIPKLNLLKNLDLEFDSFSYMDTVTGQFLGINQGLVTSENPGITIKEIEWSNPNDTIGAFVGNERRFMKIKSSNIEIHDLFVKNDLPTEIKTRKMTIGNFDMNHVRPKTVEAKVPFKLNLEFLDKYSKVFSRLQIDTTWFDDINFRYATINDTSSDIVQFNNVALRIKKIDLDTNMVGQEEPQVIESLTVDLRKRTGITQDSLYEFRTGGLHYDFPTSRLTIDSLYLKPLYNDSVFFEKAVYQTDRIDLFGKKITVNDIDIYKLVNNNYFHFGSIDFYDFDVNLFRNKNYAIEPGLYKPLPREALMAVNQKFAIDSVRFVNAMLTYKQLDTNSIKAGEIFLSDFNLTAFNLTNDIAEDDHESRIKINLDAKILGESKMTFTLFFPLYRDSTAFWLSGRTEDIDMIKLNQVTKNLMGIGITDGVGNVEVPLISGNDSIATGSLFFRYKKLRLALYNREKEELNSSFFSPVVNFFINDLVLRSNNPRFARRTKTGIVYFRRDTRKSIVNYTFKSILSGMLSTLGLNTKGQRQEKKDLKKTNR